MRCQIPAPFEVSRLGAVKPTLAAAALGAAPNERTVYASKRLLRLGREWLASIEIRLHEALNWGDECGEPWRGCLHL